MKKQEIIEKWEKEIESNKIKQQLYDKSHYRYESLQYENELISSILADLKKLNESAESEVKECDTCSLRKGYF